jgi:phosphoserine phosphatase RsbU/P
VARPAAFQRRHSDQHPSTDETGNEFDLTRLAETLLESRNQLPSELVETIQRTIIAFTNGAEPSDDRTLLALRWSPKGI